MMYRWPRSPVPILLLISCSLTFVLRSVYVAVSHAEFEVYSSLCVTGLSGECIHIWQQQPLYDGANPCTTLQDGGALSAYRHR